VSLPAIAALRQHEDEVLAEFVLSENLEVFEGHFPGIPILPGVAQIDWVMRLAARCLGLGDPVAQDFQVKFTDKIHPGMPLSLTLKIDKTRQRLSFEYRIEDRLMSSGRINLASAP
jgi:3-hydroxymyristoyl/3-hydroxydecanoyl-(acyl carrier protein) dehydratase